MDKKRNSSLFAAAALVGCLFQVVGWNLVSSIRLVQELHKPSAARTVFVMRYLPWRYLVDPMAVQRAFVDVVGECLIGGVLAGQ